MTYPEPRVTDDSVPEVEQEFDAEIAQHAARLEADRTRFKIPADTAGYVDALFAATPAEERTEGLPPLSILLDGYGEAMSRGGMVLVDPARGDLAEVVTQSERADAFRAEILRRFGTPERTGVSDVQQEVAHEVAFLRAEIMTGWWEVDTEGRDQALARLDRIEQWTRGAQR